MRLVRLNDNDDFRIFRRKSYGDLFIRVKNLCSPPQWYTIEPKVSEDIFFRDDFYKNEFEKLIPKINKGKSTELIEILGEEKNSYLNFQLSNISIESAMRSEIVGFGKKSSSNNSTTNSIVLVKEQIKKYDVSTSKKKLKACIRWYKETKPEQRRMLRIT